MYVQIWNYLAIRSGKEDIFQSGHNHKFQVRLKEREKSSVPDTQNFYFRHKFQLPGGCF